MEKLDAELWSWLEKREDLNMQISLRMARLNVPGIVGNLAQLHPTTTVHSEASDDAPETLQ
jgi:hypothetical protein